MGMSIPFQNRAVMAGNNGTAAVFYSEVFDVSNYDKLTVETQIFSADPDASTIDAGLNRQLVVGRHFEHRAEEVLGASCIAEMEVARQLSEPEWTTIQLSQARSPGSTGTVR